MNDKHRKDAIVDKSLERLVALCELEGVNITGDAKDSARLVLSSLYDTAREDVTKANGNDCTNDRAARYYRDAWLETQRRCGRAQPLQWPWP